LRNSKKRRLAFVERGHVDIKIKTARETMTKRLRLDKQLLFENVKVA
jgi:hypothetical protein